jgi:hypothetical protein
VGIGEGTVSKSKFEDMYIILCEWEGKRYVES